MSRKKPRGLRPDEEQLWQRVADTAKPLSPDTRKLAVPPLLEPATAPRAPETPRVEPFRIGQKAGKSAPSHDLYSGITDSVSQAPLQMDRKSFGRMKRGKLVPEGRIDLHGMTLSQAHPALNRFILGAHASGKRLVLVITGKGKSGVDDDPVPARRGVLRHQVPHWLATAPLNVVVLQVSQAHQKHGGGGAYYVYLRRTR